MLLAVYFRDKVVQTISFPFNFPSGSSRFVGNSDLDFNGQAHTWQIDTVKFLSWKLCLKAKYCFYGWYVLLDQMCMHLHHTLQ